MYPGGIDTGYVDPSIWGTAANENWQLNGAGLTAQDAQFFDPTIDPLTGGYIPPAFAPGIDPSTGQPMFPDASSFDASSDPSAVDGGSGGGSLDLSAAGAALNDPSAYVDTSGIFGDPTQPTLDENGNPVFDVTGTGLTDTSNLPYLNDPGAALNSYDPNAVSVETLNGLPNNVASDPNMTLANSQLEQVMATDNPQGGTTNVTPVPGQPGKVTTKGAGSGGGSGIPISFKLPAKKPTAAKPVTAAASTAGLAGIGGSGILLLGLAVLVLLMVKH